MLKIYVCGPTVYNDVHIGNLRPILTMDLILKAARVLNIDFKFIHNITDIDDKIINRALQENVSESEIATKYATYYLDILKKLKVDTVYQYEYVTKNLDIIEDFIKKMTVKNHTYISQNSLYFDIKNNLSHYGIVSKQKIEHMIFDENLREHKRFYADFALWKTTDKGIKYHSSFGIGRPGWHTECAALVYKHFNNDGLDIHGGGMDLTFPHHENENIQYFAVTDNDITKKWLRTGQINLKGQKMSKSLQNFILAKDFLNQYTGDYLKLLFLLNSFTANINIDDNAINNIEILLKKIKKIFFLKYLKNIKSNYDKDKYKNILRLLYQQKFSDFNKKINDLIKNININKKSNDISLLTEIFSTLRFDICDFDYLPYVKIYHKWQEHLQNKDYQNADLLRNTLMEQKLV
ncbi:class I tRNA ligase family protein [Mycoplasma sp. 6243]|uniref:class I tRNA ligase family protein n=1 Tax=Mycoplasma sp. 6243 TaxID=3440865 RepID=UPI003EBD0784